MGFLDDLGMPKKGDLARAIEAAVNNPSPGPISQPFILGTELRRPIEPDPGAGPFDASAGFDRSITAGPKVLPQILTHELGHIAQQDAGLTRSGAAGNILAAAMRGKSAHDPEGGAAHELSATDFGIEAIAREAHKGDPQAIELLQKITPLIEQVEKTRDKSKPLEFLDDLFK